jgi:formate--tetrahydrofolate ligase
MEGFWIRPSFKVPLLSRRAKPKISLTIRHFCIAVRRSELKPDCAVVVATVRALKMHGGGPSVVAGQALNHAYLQENLELLKAGVCNLQRHIENTKAYGIPVVVAINKFATDTDAEIELVKAACKEAGAFDAVLCEVGARSPIPLSKGLRVSTRSQNAPNVSVRF